MGISVKVEKHEQVPMGRKEKRELSDSVGFIVEQAIAALDGRLVLPKKIKVEVKTNPYDEYTIGNTSELRPDTLEFYFRNLQRITRGDEGSALNIIGVGVASHELSHMATLIRPDQISRSGDDLFDAVVDEGKADAVALAVLSDRFRVKAGVFARHERCTPAEKTSTLKALAAPRHVATTFWSRITDAAFKADVEAFERRSNVDSALNIAGGFICSKFVEITGDDPFEMHARSERAFIFSYQQLMQEEGFGAKQR